MYLITKNKSYEQIIKKSKFISYAYIINDKKDVSNILVNLKINHSGAKHICYAYVLNRGQIKKYDDDSEPSKTAGVQILNVIEHFNINNILIVVVRYFGGILLGRSGLIHAYKSSASELIKTIELKEEVILKEYKIKTTYKEYENIIKFSNIKVFNVVYNENIEFSFSINENDIDLFISYLEKYNMHKFAKLVKNKKM